MVRHLERARNLTRALKKGASSFRFKLVRQKTCYARCFLGSATPCVTRISRSRHKPKDWNALDEAQRRRLNSRSGRSCWIGWLRQPDSLIESGGGTGPMMPQQPGTRNDRDQPTNANANAPNRAWRSCLLTRDFLKPFGASSSRSRYGQIREGNRQARPFSRL